MCIVLIVSPIVYIDLGYFYKPNANCIFMIGLVWLLMMRMFKIWEIPKPEVAAVYPRRKKCSPGQNDVGDMSEDNHPHSLSLHPASCEQDLNSNCATTTPQETTTVITASRLSNVSSNDAADHHDRPDHQRLADYGGYKEQNGTTPSTTTTTPCTNSNRRHPPSIFAFLNSPNLQGDFTYEDLSRNIDANLAEIDMEDFRSEDINSILALPAMYCGDFRSQNHGEQAASLSCSIMAKFDAFDSSSITHYSTSGESTDMSVCKSEPLFSPVKETMPFPAFSIDSLDCDSYNEQELMLTCQANMNNYTIAFEGSMTKYSDDSDYHEANGSETTESDSWSGGNFKLRSSDSIDGSLVQSDFGYTTWSKLKRVNDVIPQKFPQVQNPTCKSQSLPNLFRKSDIASDIKISQLNVSTDSDQCVPVYDVQSSHSTHFSQSSASSSQQSLSLMRLFMQQKNAGTGSSASSSIIHSLSSGTLQQMEVTYSNATSTDERLQQVLSARLNESDCSVSDFYDGDSSKDDIPHWRQKSVGAKESIGSPSHLLHAMKNVGDTTAKTTLKRRLRSSSGTCKMFGGEAMHEDSTGRAISPMASPIEEEDEDDEMMGGWIDSVENGRSSETDDMDSEPTMVCKSTKNDVWRDIMSRRHKIDNLTIANNLKATLRLNSEFNKNNVKHDGIGSKADNSSTSANLSQGTQTKCFSNNNNNNNYYYKFPSQTDTTFNKISLTTSPPALSTFKGQDYFSPKKRLNGTGEATCSSSSGYTSIRSTSTEQMQRTSPMSGAQHDDLKKGSCKHNVTITEFKTCSTQIPVHVHDEAIQTSFQGEWLQRILASCARIRLADRMVQTDVGRRLEEKVQHSHRCPEKKSIYVCYPNYSLPDLGFLRECGVKSEAFSKALLLPVNNLATSCPLKKYAPRPQSCTALESLRQIDLNRIQDWDSLNVLLPQDVQKMLAELRSKKVSEAKEPGKDNTREIASDDGLEHHDTGPNSPSPLTSQSPSSTKKDGLHHMYVYQYDSYEIEDTERGPQVRIPPPLPKRSISLPQGDCQNIGSAIPEQYVATKPPLPKGILRRSGALTTGRKSPAVKRYSMPDFLILQQQQENVHNSRQRMQSCNYPCSCTLSNGGLTNLLNLGQKPYALSDDCKPLGPTSGLPKAQLDTEGMSRCSPNHAVADIDNVDKDILSSCPLCTKTSSPKDDDVVEGILNIQRQRSLLEHYENHGQHQELNQDCTSDACCHEQESKNKKTVSFSSNVQTGDQEWHQDKQEERGSLNPRDDEAAPIQCQCLRGNATPDWTLPTLEDPETPPQEFCVSPIKDNIVVPSADLWQQKRDLVRAVKDAVESLNNYFDQAKDPHGKFILGSCLQTPQTGHKVLQNLCPALFGVLNDGLKAEVYNSFGHVDNSVWMVVETVTQSVKCTKQMSDLVIHVNNEQNLQGKDLKFNAFIFGLLNIRSLDSWFSLLGTCQNIIQKHYLPEAFLYLVKTTMKTLFDQLLLSLQMLSLLPFDLDLASEISLQNQSPVDCNVGIQHLEWEKTCPFLLSPDACVTTLSASIPVDCQMLSHHLSGIFRESPATFCSGTSGFTRDVITEKSKDDTDGGVSSSRLRRGCSQDSAIATGSSDYSNGSCPVINTSGDGDTDTHKPKTRRPFSCIECVGGWNVLNDEHLVINTSHPENVSQRITEDPRLCPKHALENDAASQETESLFFRPDPGGLGQCQQQKEENDIVDQINVDGDVEEEAEDNCEDEARDTEKGSLDATIAEPRHSDISSHNNGKETMNETAVNFPYDGDEDGAKFKELRMKWEILSCAGSEKKRAVNPNTRSKIPRLVTPPLKLSGRMEDSGGSAKTSASATTTSESNSSRSIISVVGDCLKSEENPRTPVEGRKSRLSLESPPCSLNGSGTKPNANLKLPTGQPFIVVKSSLDKSPVRKRLPVCKKVPSIPNSMQVKCKQVVSRGVGGPEQDEN